jgi:hypothetical protein
VEVARRLSSFEAIRELQPGLWHWEAPHPDWSPDEPWGEVVSSYAIDAGERLLLLDPIAPPSEMDELAAERETVVVLTAPWHERDTRSLVEWLGTPVFVPAPDTEDDLMQKFGITREQAAGGSPDVAWLISGETGDGESNDLVLWIEQHRAVAGDTLVDFGRGLEIPVGWLREGVTREQVVEGLRPLLDRPVELVLATHGGQPSARPSSARSPDAGIELVRAARAATSTREASRRDRRSARGAGPRRMRRRRPSSPPRRSLHGASRPRRPGNRSHRAARRARGSPRR